jgi:hypothetical protein
MTGNRDQKLTPDGTEVKATLAVAPCTKVHGGVPDAGAYLLMILTGRWKSDAKMCATVMAAAAEGATNSGESCAPDPPAVWPPAAVLAVAAVSSSTK